MITDRLVLGKKMIQLAFENDADGKCHLLHHGILLALGFGNE